jgi:hypothetical protein
VIPQPPAYLKELLDTFVVRLLPKHIVASSRLSDDWAQIRFHLVDTRRQLCSCWSHWLTVGDFQREEKVNEEIRQLLAEIGWWEN